MTSVAVIDDNGGTRQPLSAGLKRRGHDVLAWPYPQKPEELHAWNPGFIFCDVYFPGNGGNRLGLNFADEYRQIDPVTPILVMSAVDCDDLPNFAGPVLFTQKWTVSLMLEIMEVFQRSLDELRAGYKMKAHAVMKNAGKGNTPWDIQRIQRPFSCAVQAIENHDDAWIKNFIGENR